LYHFGVLDALRPALNKLNDVIPDKQTLCLQLNIDGLPLYKSSSMQFWPVLGLLKGLPMKTPVVITLFCGISKPLSLVEFLGTVVREIRDLSRGFAYHTKQFFTDVTAVVCDAPARSFVKAVKSHIRYSGCDKCCVVGEYIEKRITFPDLNAPLRSDASFKDMIDEEHPIGQSPFTDILGMISCFPHDYMHMVCLGVMKRLLKLWTSGPLTCHLPSRLVENISSKLVNFRQFMPTEFARLPRTIKELDRWKATELREFLLYSGPVALYDVLRPEVYAYFTLLSVAVYILLSKKYCATHFELAPVLLHSFVGHFQQLCGDQSKVK
jgi:hypothetical protein